MSQSENLPLSCCGLCENKGREQKKSLRQATTTHVSIIKKEVGIKTYRCYRKKREVGLKTYRCYRKKRKPVILLTLLWWAGTAAGVKAHSFDHDKATNIESSDARKSCRSC
jgi:hypothetical protein